jgi:hypothetical protein
VTGNSACAPSARSYALVRTAPLSPSAIVATQAFRGGRVMTSFGRVAVVWTAPGGQQLRTIDDDTLLALVAPRPAVLVRLGTGPAKLIFAKPDGASDAGVD